METTTAQTNGVLLATEQLMKEYSGRRVVDGVSVNVKAGEIVGLLGPNGAGKTTTFNMVVGVIKPDDGAVKFQARDITRLPMHKRARLGIGYLTQEPSVFRKLTVAQNILAILETCKLSRDANRRQHGVSNQRRREAPAGNHTRIGHQSQVDVAGRTLQRH